MDNFFTQRLSPNQLVFQHEISIITFVCFAGFTTASRGCCGIGSGGQVAGIIPCVPTSSLCSDRHKHVFWDQYHPSEAANIILAKQLINGDKRYISPMNLRQLIDLWPYINFQALICPHNFLFLPQFSVKECYCVKKVFKPLFFFFPLQNNVNFTSVVCFLN